MPKRGILVADAEDIARLREQLNEVLRIIARMKAKRDGVDDVAKGVELGVKQVIEAAIKIKHDENNVRAIVRSIDAELEAWNNAIANQIELQKKEEG